MRERTTAGGSERSLALRLGIIIVTMAVTAACDAWLRGEAIARSAAFVSITLAAPALLFASALRLLDRGGGCSSAAAAGLVLVVAGNSAMWLDSRFAILAPKGHVALAASVAAFGLGFAVCRFTLRRLPAPAFGRTRGLLGGTFAALALAMIATGAIPRGAPPAASPGDARGPNIVLVTIDTLRADHLSIYGYAAHQTPHLDRLAREGVRFESAFAPSPWTLATLAASMTGYQPSVLGIDNKTGLPSGVPTLAGSLRGGGYRTHAIVTNVYLERPYHLDSGFDGYDHLNDLGAFDDLSRHPLYRLAQKTKRKLLGDHAGRVTDRAVAWLGSPASLERPFFLWVHYVDPHQPYGGRHVSDDLPCGSREAPEIGGLFTRAWQVRRGRLALTPAEREHLIHLYDAEIRFVDREVGRLFAALESAGLTDSTLVVTTADHGEEFWDHGGFEHGHSLHQEVTRVPLLARWPGRLEKGLRIDEPVSLLDLMPTLLAAAGIEPPPSQGRVLPGFGASPPPGPVLSENLLYGPEQKAVRDERHAVFLDASGNVRRIYDRRSDPFEKAAVASDAAPDLARFAARQIERNTGLQDEVGGHRSVRAELTDFQREQLRALGYVD